MSGNHDGCHAGSIHGPSGVRLTSTPGSFNLSNVHHVGMVVRDREKSLAGIGSLFGGPVYRLDATFPPARMGERVDTATLKLAFVWLGNMLVEMLEPVNDSSIQGQFLKDHGEGLHHLGFITPSIDAQLAAVRRANPASVIADGTIPGNAMKWAYVELPELPGTVVELIERSSTAEQFFGGIYKVTGGRLPG